MSTIHTKRHTDSIPAVRAHGDAPLTHEQILQQAGDDLLGTEAGQLALRLEAGQIDVHTAAVTYGRACDLLGRPDPYAGLTLPPSDDDDNAPELPWWAR